MRLTAVRSLAAAVLALAGLTLSACSSSGGGSEQSSGPASTSSTPAAAHYYVSVGDSYAASYQPTAEGQGHTTTEGFADDVVKLAKDKGYTLVNFGCGGATTESILKSPGCEPAMRAVNGPAYTAPQAQAAEEFVKAHAGQIGLITVSIGGNDITRCGLEEDAVGCLTTSLPSVSTNLGTLLTGLRQAAGPDVKIVGITYPDVFLGEKAIKGGNSSLADLSVLGFESFINPALKKAYEAAGASFVDVTTATGAYGSQKQTTEVAGYGMLPTPVAKICELTYYCQYQDIHPRASGYQLIAELIVDELS